MKKEAYIKPTMQVVLLQHQGHLLAGSPLNNVSSNLDSEDELLIGETPVGEGFRGR